MTDGHKEEICGRIHRLGEQAIIASLAIDGLEERDTVTGLIELSNLLKSMGEDLTDIAEILLFKRSEEGAAS